MRLASAIADRHAVAGSLLADFDRSSLDAQVLSDEWAERLHRAAELTAEDATQRLGLFARGLVVYLTNQVRSLAYPDQEKDVEKPLLPSAA